MNREALAKAVRQQLARARAEQQVVQAAKRAERDAHIAQQAASRDADRKAREAKAETEGVPHE